MFNRCLNVYKICTMKMSVYKRYPINYVFHNVFEISEKCGRSRPKVEENAQEFVNVERGEYLAFKRYTKSGG